MGVRRNKRQGVGDASLFLRERTEWHLGRITEVTFVGAAGERIDLRSQSSLSRVVWEGERAWGRGWMLL